MKTQFAEICELQETLYKNALKYISAGTETEDEFIQNQLVLTNKLIEILAKAGLKITYNNLCNANYHYLNFLLFRQRFAKYKKLNKEIKNYYKQKKITEYFN